MRDLKALLDKYWKGESDLEEEKLLKERSSENEGTADVDFFRYLKEKSQQGIDGPEFDSMIIRNVRKQKSGAGRVSILLNWRVAAAIAVLFAASVMFKLAVNETGNPDESSIVDTYEDPEKALEETKKALLLVSAKLNKGNEYTVEFGRFSESQEKLKN